MTLIWISQEIVRFSTTGYDISMAVKDLRISSTVVDSLEYVSHETWVLRWIFLGYRRAVQANQWLANRPYFGIAQPKLSANLNRSIT